ncbi:MAG: hypothetical protein WCG87_06615 [Bacteroidota bacterium]
MAKKLLKKTLIGLGSTLLLLAIVLCVHIYIVTRPKPLNAQSLTMVRIDIQQPIDQTDADKISQWLYAQKGVDHVLCNPQTKIVVFTYHTISTTANEIVRHFKSDLNYKAERFVPSEEDMKKGCPMAATSVTYKVYNFFRHTFS